MEIGSQRIRIGSNVKVFEPIYLIEDIMLLEYIYLFSFDI